MRDPNRGFPEILPIYNWVVIFSWFKWVETEVSTSSLLFLLDAHHEPSFLVNLVFVPDSPISSYTYFIRAFQHQKMLGLMVQKACTTWYYLWTPQPWNMNVLYIYIYTHIILKSMVEIPPRNEGKQERWVPMVGRKSVVCRELWTIRYQPYRIIHLICTYQFQVSKRYTTIHVGIQYMYISWKPRAIKQNSRPLESLIVNPY